MTGQPTVVLVVDQDSDPRERMAGWLMQAGYEVLTCPGPVAPSYTCIGGRGERCPLAAAAEVVVLNLELASDTALAGTPALKLLCYYLGLGKGVVALGRPGDSVRPFEQEQVALISRPAERDALLHAVGDQVIELSRTPARPAGRRHGRAVDGERGGQGPCSPVRLARHPAAAMDLQSAGRSALLTEGDPA